MSRPKPSSSISVDLANPGQVIACCGLLELAHRRWPGAEGWFERSQFVIAGRVESDDDVLSCLVKTLADCEISGLSKEERDEREKLEAQTRDLKRKGSKLPADQEERRRQLGKQARAGVIRIGEPFAITLDWWQTGDDEATPKTWAGLQELHKIARAAQNALSGISEPTTLMDHGSVLTMPEEYRKGKSDHKQSVEPFYFDARRFAHPLDAGFSLDIQDAQTVAHPAVELLCLIGLQRFRPAPAPVKWRFDYWVWSRPLGAPIAAAVFGGAASIAGREEHRFQLRFRDDRKRYKAFGRAARVGGDS